MRGFPTLWRLATEYLFLRKLAPRSRLFNAFYGNGFDHDSEREAEFVMGAAMLVRRAAIDQVGPLDEGFFLFSEETDWCYRFRQAGWKVLFYPGAEVFHVYGASHGGRLFREQVRGHLRFMAKHHGARAAERTRRLLRASLLLRGALFRGERGQAYRDAARWLGSGSAAALAGVESEVIERAEQPSSCGGRTRRRGRPWPSRRSRRCWSFRGCSSRGSCPEPASGSGCG